MNCSDSDITSPSFLPDGFIAFTKLDQFSGYRQVYKMDLNGENLEQMCFIPYHVWSVRINPDGNSVSWDFNIGIHTRSIQIYNFNNNSPISILTYRFYYLKGWNNTGDKVLTSDGYNIRIYDINTEIIQSLTVLGEHQFYVNPGSICFTRSAFEDEDVKVYYFTPGEPDTSLVTVLPHKSFKHHFCWETNTVISYIGPHRNQDILIYDWENHEILKRFSFHPRDDGPRWSNDPNYFCVVGWLPEDYYEDNYNIIPYIYIFTRKGDLVTKILSGEDILSAEIYFNVGKEHYWDTQ